MKKEHGALMIDQGDVDNTEARIKRVIDASISAGAKLFGKPKKGEPMKKKVITTGDKEAKPKQAAEVPARPLDLSKTITTGDQPVMDDKAFCIRYGSEDEFKAMRETIEDRKAKEPAFAYYKCNSGRQTCKMPVLKVKHGSIREDQFRACAFCNPRLLAGEAHYIKMSAAEAKAYERAQDEAAKRRAAEAPKKAQELAEFNKRLFSEGKY